MTVGPLEVCVLLFVVFLILGPKRLTNLFRSVGRGVRDFGTELGRDRKKAELAEEPTEDTRKRG